MAEVVSIKKYIGFEKGKAPKVTFDFPADGLVPYLSPEYLRGTGNPLFVKPSNKLASIDDGELIILWDGSNAGEVFVSKKGILGSTMTKIVFDENAFDKSYFSYALKYNEYFLKAKTAGSGIPHVDKGIVKKIEVFKPELDEQSTIASILSKVDEAIAATKNSISKAEHLKKSLMQNLLTGKLKPDGTWRKDDEYYVDEKFGFLPIGWEVKPLKELATVQRGKFSHRPRNEPRFYDGIHPFVQTSDVVNSVFYLKEYSQTLSDAGTGVSRKFPKGTIIITIAANIGDVAITNYDVYFPDSLIGINHNEELINDEFLLISLITKKQFLNQVSTESAQKNINYGNLRPLPIFLPSDKTEQIKIAEKIKAVFNIIEEKQTKVKKLERLKKALMQNLLTGKVRVKIKETING